MNKIQETLLDLIDEEDDIDTENRNFQNMVKLIDNLKIRENPQKLKILLNLIINITDNHYRGPDFFTKIEKVLNLVRESITQYYSNFDLFNIFKSNKRILLYFINENIITIDKIICNIIIKGKYLKYKYPQYFIKEIAPFVKENKQLIDEIPKEIPEYFENNRKFGTNEDYMCRLIQADLIDDFISYANRSNISLGSTINQSIYETNSFLLENNPSLIEYALFYGSIQIFNYLRLNHVQLNENLWLYAIHGKNPDIIHLLEEYQIISDNKSNKKIIKESIKCHHNDISNYIISNYFNYDNSISKYGIKYHNYAFIKETYCLYELCKYDYAILVNILLQNDGIDVNRVGILLLFNHVYFYFYQVQFYNVLCNF